MGLEGKSVKLRCTFTRDVQEALSREYSYSVRWHDVVHNEGGGGVCLEGGEDVEDGSVWKGGDWREWWCL